MPEALPLPADAACGPARCDMRLQATLAAWLQTMSVNTARREALVRAAGSAELFLAMRGAYTASLAATSATGYCAGVGDRHMGNIMLHASGRLVPIDFGCEQRVGLHPGCSHCNCRLECLQHMTRRLAMVC